MIEKNFFKCPKICFKLDTLLPKFYGLKYIAQILNIRIIFAFTKTLETKSVQLLNIGGNSHIFLQILGKQKSIETLNTI